MQKSTRYTVFFSIVAVIVALVLWYKLAPGKYDGLATCLKDEGVKFYGAFWCPHCKATKGEFGKSATKLPYIECSNPDGQSQNDLCTEANVVSYPTWEFPKELRIAATDADTTVACDAPLADGATAPGSCEGAPAGTWVTTTNGRPFTSPSQPTLADKVWTLPALSRTSGEVPLDLLGALASCPVPGQ